MGIPDKTALIGQINDRICRRLSQRDAEKHLCFAGEFLDHYPLRDLGDKSLDMLTGMLEDAYQFIDNNKRKQAKIRIYNPDSDDDGWQSSHTIITIHCRNMPFLMDSIRLTLARHQVILHSVKSTPLMIYRDSKGTIDKILPSAGSYDLEGNEAFLYFEINRLTKVKDIHALTASIRNTLKEIKRVTQDYEPMQKTLRQLPEKMAFAKKRHGKADVAKVVQFVDWLMTNSFTFLGYAYFEMEGQKKNRQLVKSLGLLKQEPGFISEALLHSHKSRGSLLSFGKSPLISTVHRPAYPDHIIFKDYDQQHKLVGEHHVLGLYTASVYRDSILNIPILREKVETLYSNISTNINSHNGRVIRQVLETYPRDELFQSHVDELTDTIVPISQINERPQVRLFMRKDWVGDFAYAMVYIPRDVFSTRLRSQLLKHLSEAVGAQASDFYTYYSESILARTYMIFRLNPKTPKQWDVIALEQQLQALSRSWSDRLQAALVADRGEEQGVDDYQRYQHSFSNGYQENFVAAQALADIAIVDTIDDEHPLAFNLCEPKTEAPQDLRFQLFHKETPLILSDVIPVLERMNLKVIGEHPYRLRTPQGTIWLHDFQLQSEVLAASDFHAMKARFEAAFANIWHGNAENDAFNGLVLAAQIQWREVVVLRAYAAYMKQTLFPLSRRAIITALMHYPAITGELIALFHSYFHPQHQDNSASTRTQKIIASLDQVSNLNDDRVIRRYLDLMQATLRTNYYQQDNGGEKAYISFKFSPRDIADIPEPRPLYEIFVYSPRVEGVHLRAAKVARGGLRWSDRLEDFRTEVLGLVKAQQVKNAVIVPSGAKGGFVAKQAGALQQREAFLKEGIACYQIFIRGLLDLTDNLVRGKIVPPKAVVRRDQDDPYLVVAADKGTATFSDIANAISLEYRHWLGDAFASGGSQGYDHKAMGITARGAWVSVQRHFKERGINVQQQEFTVIGIGDMAGDVFGNGMLMSEHICLTAAFNHLHIFIDPNPQAGKSFQERQRLFNTPGSSWGDYQRSLISKGGGVFSRQAKAIAISAEMKARFGITATKLTPTDLIVALLKAPVDLLWNGGIGTYIKAIDETHADIGDKTNDALRINGVDLRCRVLGEGGNLGVSQRGRIEYAMHGGACNTDFIDNAAGVDCSDHEVNIKILLNQGVATGKLSEKQRNHLLASMTNAVAEKVLRNNYHQTQSLSLSAQEALGRFGEYQRLMNTLEANGQLDRRLQCLPTDEQMLERLADKKSLTRPELSTLNCYVKVILKEALAVDDIADNPYCEHWLQRAFPAQLVRQFSQQIKQHILRKEIIATQLANDMVDTMGITFCHRLMASTGKSAAAVATAYMMAKAVFQFEQVKTQVEALDYEITAKDQLELLAMMVRRVRRGTRWFLRNSGEDVNLQTVIETYQAALTTVIKETPSLLVDAEKQRWEKACRHFEALGLSRVIAARVAMPSRLFSGLGVAHAALQGDFAIKHSVAMHHLLGDKLGLYWFADAVAGVDVDNHWQAMARESFIDDIDSALRRMSMALLRLVGKHYQLEEALQLWMQEHPAPVSRWRQLAHDLQTSSTPDFAMFSVAMRELNDLVVLCDGCRQLRYG
ncbi:MAG: NAD-glutamate dehydrogenase [Cellvibrionaceae bacterium]|nr:NAD-glutamate dehydrogenase [Cellvibrionaceae bacterium]